MTEYIFKICTIQKCVGNFAQNTTNILFYNLNGFEFIYL